MSEESPRLTAEQASVVAEMGANPELAVPSAAPGRVFVYVELPTRTIRHEIDETGRVVRTDVFVRSRGDDAPA